MLVDAHTHLDKNDKNFYGFLNSTNLHDFLKVKEACLNHEKIIPFYGIHPWHLDKIDLSSPFWLDHLQTFLLQNPHAGIGEIGLDKIKAKKGLVFCLENQIKVLSLQLELAQKLNRPVTIHQGGYTQKIIAILTPYKSLKILFHGFSGSKETAQILVHLGFYLSFLPQQEQKLQKIKPILPINQLFLETDGKKENKENFENFYKKVALLWGCSFSDFKKRMIENAKVFTGSPAFR